MTSLYTVTQGYGATSDARKSKTNPTGTNHGIDIGTPAGTPLNSVVAGTVKVAGTSKTLGRYIVIVGNDGREYWFGHLSSLGVKKGQSVSVGQNIGATGGDTSDPQHGNATGPHLWFAVKAKGAFIDPTSAVDQKVMFGAGAGAGAAPSSPVPAPTSTDNLRTASDVLGQAIADYVGADAATVANLLHNFGQQLREHASTVSATPGVALGTVTQTLPDLPSTDQPDQGVAGG